MGLRHFLLSVGLNCGLDHPCAHSKVAETITVRHGDPEESLYQGSSSGPSVAQNAEGLIPSITLPLTPSGDVFHPYRSLR